MPIYELKRTLNIPIQFDEKENVHCTVTFELKRTNDSVKLSEIWSFFLDVVHGKIGLVKSGDYSIKKNQLTIVSVVDFVKRVDIKKLQIGLESKIGCSINILEMYYPNRENDIF